MTTSDDYDPFGSPTERPDPLRLHGLKVTNYRRIQAVDLEFHEGAGVTEIRGANEQGKTSLIDAVWEAIGGAPRPDAIRKGSKDAEVQVDLGELRVVRRWKRKADGGVSSSLKVTDEHGEKVAKPQELLSSLLSRVSIDPLAWVDKGLRGAGGRREQANDLLASLQIPAPTGALADACDPLGLAFDDTGHAFAQIKSADEVVREARAAANREVKSARATFESLAEHAGDLDAEAPTEDEVKAATEAWKRARSIADRVDAEQREVDRLKAHLEAATQRLDEAQAELADLGSIDELERKAEALRDAAHGAEIARGAREARVKLQEWEKRAGVLESVLAEIASVKEATLASVLMPVEGLAFDEDGLTYKGRPFPDSASGEERITVGLGVAMASAPRLRLLRVDDGNRLDRFNRAQVKKLVQDSGFQLLLVLVDDDGTEPGIVIEDGRAREVEA